LLGGLYRLFDLGETPNLDGLREDIENPRLIEWAIDQQEVGRGAPERALWLKSVLERFRADRRELKQKKLMDRLRSAETDEERQRLLREIQDVGRDPNVRAVNQSP
jgi:hypothetical protein